MISLKNFIILYFQTISINIPYCGAETVQEQLHYLRWKPNATFPDGNLRRLLGLIQDFTTELTLDTGVS